MSIILQQKERIATLEKEKEMLEKILMQVQQDIVFVAGSVKTAWETLGLDPEKLSKSNKALLITSIAGKVMKKGTMEILTTQFENVMPVMKKYAHLIEEKPQIENSHGN